MSQEHLMDAAPEEVNPYTPGSGQIGEEHADQDATIALLRDQLKEAEIQRLRALLEAANAANAAMAGPNGTDGRKPRPRIPDPVRFKGDRSEWLSWRTMMAAKLKVDHAAIGSLSDQFVYIYSRLEGNAWKNVTTFVNTPRRRWHSQESDQLPRSHLRRPQRPVARRPDAIRHEAGREAAIRQVPPPVGKNVRGGRRPFVAR